jgi:hypothetical protein
MRKGILSLLFLCCFIIIPWSLFATNIVISSNWAMGEKIVDTARDYLGTPYVYAGVSKKGVDCSGLVHSVYKDAARKTLPRRVVDLLNAGSSIPGSPAPGDLVFFDTTGGPSHVGIYIGGKKFVHAASEGPRTGVIISSLEERYYRTRYIGARRYLPKSATYIEVNVDDKGATTKLAYRVPTDTPFHMAIVNELSHPRWFVVKVYQNDQFVFSKRIRSDPKHDPSRFWFIPSSGDWRVSLEDQAKGRMLKLDFVSGASK